MVIKAEQVAMDAGGGLNNLYRRYAVWLHRRLRTRISPDDAADVVQETYIKVAPYASGDIRHPKALLLQIALNLVRDESRRSSRRQWPSGEAKPPQSEAAAQFDQVLLAQIIRAMPQLYRDVFVLSRFDGMTYPEIARLLGISVATVEWRMARAVEYCASRLNL